MIYPVPESDKVYPPDSFDTRQVFYRYLYERVSDRMEERNEI